MAILAISECYRHLYIYIYIYIYIYAVNIVQYSVKLLPCPRFESETLHVKNFLPEMLDSC